ncbi:HAD family hydrolase [Microbacterium gorillae]|uniref:HAD family hydrolase n=1 Tax=Microbacterium gorillae TaxID=1231063 RepID=UPI00069324FE|nr:haloacid dehalogenase-like hydrolase [Microbacterium gorillae]
MKHPDTAVILDFDGTVALGDGPVRAYARAVERRGGVTGVEPVLNAVPADALDGYDAVRMAAESAGVSAADLSAAYLDSRAELATEDAPIHAPVGLAEFLTAAGEAGVLRLLVTNAPDIRIAPALAALGIADGIDRVVTDAAKPGGLDAQLDELAAAGVVRVLSIGDIWRNDLAPAHRRGHTTALVGDHPDEIATPTHRASTFGDLAPALQEWLDAVPSDSTASTAL